MANVRIMNQGQRKVVTSVGVLKPRGTISLDSKEAKRIMKLFPKELIDMDKNYQEKVSEADNGKPAKGKAKKTAKKTAKEVLEEEDSEENSEEPETEENAE